MEPADTQSADLAFDRRWALTLLETARARLRAEFARSGKSARFGLLEGCLPGERTGRTYAEIASELGLSESAIKLEMHRMKWWYAELLREEVGKTVANPAEVDEEIRHLMDVFARR